MQVEHAAAHVRHLLGQIMDPLVQLILVQLTRRVPGCAVRVPQRQHRVSVELHHRLVAALDVDALTDAVLERLRIVVAGHDKAADARAGEPVVGQLDPLAERVQHDRLKPLLTLLLGQAGDAVDLGVRGAVGIHAVPAHTAFQRVQLRLVAGLLAAAEQARRPGAVFLEHDRDHDLAGDVTAHHQHPRVVHLRRVQELLPQHLGAVDVGGVVEAEGIIALRLLFALEQSQSVLLGWDLEVVE